MEAKLQPSYSSAAQHSKALQPCTQHPVLPCSQARKREDKEGIAQRSEKNKHTQSHAHSVAFAVKGYRGFVMLTWCLFTGMSSRWNLSLHLRTRTGHTRTEAIMCIGRRSQCKGRRKQPRDRRGKQYSYTLHRLTYGRSMTEVAVNILRP